MRDRLRCCPLPRASRSVAGQTAIRATAAGGRQRVGPAPCGASSASTMAITGWYIGTPEAPQADARW